MPTPRISTAGALAPAELPQGPQELLRGPDRVTARLAVDVQDDLACVIDERKLRAGRADVDPQETAGRLTRRPRQQADLVVHLVDEGFGRVKGGVDRTLHRQRPGIAAGSINGRGGGGGKADVGTAGHCLAGSSDRGHQVRGGWDEDPIRSLVLQPAQHLSVLGDAADDGRHTVERFALQQGAQHRAGHAPAKPGPHRGFAAALLLAMDEIALGKDRASGGDRRRVVDGAKDTHLLIGNAQASRLLVEERTRAGGTGGVGGVALELPFGIELDVGGGPSSDIDDVSDVRKLPADRQDLTARHVEPGHAEEVGDRGGAGPRQPDGRVRTNPQFVQHRLQRRPRTALMQPVDVFQQATVDVEPNRFDEQGSDIDTDRALTFVHGDPPITDLLPTVTRKRVACFLPIARGYGFAVGRPASMLVAVQIPPLANEPEHLGCRSCRQSLDWTNR